MEKRLFVLATTVTFVVMVTALEAPVKLRRQRRGWLSGTKPPNAVCAFDPCQIKDFCEGGRVCELDNTYCRHNCRCVPGSTHEMCVSKTTEIPEQNTSDRVTIDTDTTDGELNLISANVTDTPIISTVSEFLENGCPPGFPCFHGHCESAMTASSGGVGIHCVCDPGWDGTFCDTEASPETCDDSKCEENEVCVTLSTHFVCVPSISEDLEINSTRQLTPVNSTLHACNPEYVTRNDSERRCASIGLLCTYGMCVERSDGGVMCRCDPGGTGTLCREKCCLDCGINGECRLNNSGQEFCNCRNNFTGEFCNALKQTGK